MTTTLSSRPFGHTLVVSLAFSGLIMALQAPENAAAQEWRLEPELRVGVEYDDNARLRGDATQEIEIDGYILEGSAGIAYLTQRTTFRVTPRLRSRVYDEEIDVDSDDQFLDIEWLHETLKSNFTVRGDYSRESARTAERANADIDEEEPEEIPTDETGFVFGNERRERFRIMPQWRYQFTERLSFDTKFIYTDTAYDENAIGPLRDFTDKRVTAALARQFTERTRGYLGATARQFESELGNTVDGVGLRAGVASDISQTTRFQVEIGFEETDREGGAGTDSNVVADINLVRSLETIRMLAQYRRDISAGGSGRVTARDSVNLALKKQFSERMSAGVGVRAYQTDGLGDQAVTFEERDYREFHAEFGYALSRTFALEADYRFSQLDRSGTEGSADSNSIILWLVYRPTPTIW